MQKSNEYVEIDLSRILKALWHRAWIILVAVALFGGTAFSYAAFIISPQ